MATGTIKWFNDAKGFGFITPDDESGDVFVHYSNIVGQSGRRTLLEGERVEYEAIERDTVCPGGFPTRAHLYEATRCPLVSHIILSLRKQPFNKFLRCLCSRLQGLARYRPRGYFTVELVVHQRGRPQVGPVF